jgi:hypothetical protein
MGDLKYTGDVDDLDDIADDDLGDALAEANEHQQAALHAATVARMCARGWDDRIQAIENRLDALRMEGDD